MRHTSKPFSFHKRSGSLAEHLSLVQARNFFVSQAVGVLGRAPIAGPSSKPTDTEDHTQCETRAPTPLWPCYHRMCVIAWRLGWPHWWALIMRLCHPSSQTLDRKNGNVLTSSELWFLAWFALVDAALGQSGREFFLS